MKRLSEQAKLDIGLVAQALNNTNATGRYFNMSSHRKALFALICGAMAATKATTLALYEGTDASGSDSQAISGASAIITANAKVTKSTVALASVGTGDIVTINGIAFTKAAATDATAREFADAAGLVTCVNNATYGVSGVTASAASTTVTLVATDPGAVYLTVSNTDVGGTVTVATAEAISFVELDVSQMDLADGFSHVAAKVTTTANTVVSVLLLRGDGRFSPSQIVGASAVV